MGFGHYLVGSSRLSEYLGADRVGLSEAAVVVADCISKREGAQQSSILPLRDNLPRWRLGSAVEGLPRYWALQHVNPSIAQGSRPVGFAHEYVLRSTCRFSPELPAAALCDCRSQPVREVPGTHQVCPSLST